MIAISSVLFLLGGRWAHCWPMGQYKNVSLRLKKIILIIWIKKDGKEKVEGLILLFVLLFICLYFLN